MTGVPPAVNPIRASPPILTLASESAYGLAARRAPDRRSDAPLCVARPTSEV